MPTSTGAADSDEVVVFNAGVLEWNSDSAANAILGALQGKYGDWTLDDFNSAFGPKGDYIDGEYGYEWVDGWDSSATPEHSEMRKYLSEVAQGNISSTISASEAQSYLQGQFDAIVAYGQMYYGIAQAGAFPCKTISFAGCDFTNIDLSECTGITGEKLASANSYTSVQLPEITLSGDEDLSGTVFWGTDLSKLNGLTLSHLATAAEVSDCTMPAWYLNGTEDLTSYGMSGGSWENCTGMSGAQAVDLWKLGSGTPSQLTFTGSEDFSGQNFYGKDVRGYTGITAAQIAEVDSVFYMEMTQAQYDAWLPTLKSAFQDKHPDGIIVYVDGVSKTIEWWE